MGFVRSLCVIFIHDIRNVFWHHDQGLILPLGIRNPSGELRIPLVIITHVVHLLNNCCKLTVPGPLILYYGILLCVCDLYFDGKRVVNYTLHTMIFFLNHEVLN